MRVHLSKQSRRTPLPPATNLPARPLPSTDNFFGSRRKTNLTISEAFWVSDRLFECGHLAAGPDVIRWIGPAINSTRFVSQRPLPGFFRMTVLTVSASMIPFERRHGAADRCAH
jgi:hypothetical protein